MTVIAGRVCADPRDVEELVAGARATYPVAARNPGDVVTSFGVDDASAGVVTVVEKWLSPEVLSEHLSTPRVQQVFTGWAPRMRHEVRMHDASDERDPRA